MSAIDHLAMTPDESPVEYLERLIRSLETPACYTIEKMNVSLYPAFGAGSISIKWTATPELIATAAKSEEE